MSTKTRIKKYLQVKKDPSYAVLEYLENIDGMVERMVGRAMSQITREAQGKAREAMKEIINGVEKQLPTISRNITNQLTREVMNNKEAFRGPKGDRGDSIQGPQGKEGPAGYTPQAGIDFPDEKEIKKMIVSLLPDEKTLKKVFAEMIEETGFDEGAYKAIARGIESLPEKEKLDYDKGLKNKPNIPKSEAARGMLRGGGEKTLYYDLSTETDGATKVFTIPSNKRVLGVFGTDFPGGGFRPEVDWTTSGVNNTVLTLTSEVDAPTSGATLYIIYVP